MGAGTWEAGAAPQARRVHGCARESDGSPFLQAAEALGTDGAAGRGSVQSSTNMAKSKELLQHMVGVEWLLVRGGWGCRP